jgi:hypothetical protein
VVEQEVVAEKSCALCCHWWGGGVCWFK